ncbi:acyl-CoA dehydrogenase family protein [Halobacillus ihumii]|uniref:acyl-CoA dehydrogenase family protein n=1 Tax=Halobacillus ihumii TaxID=2686092 RepID=UPI0013D0C3DD|nr:acyl-CoA dehydrogenase family protein [Halobacillus ihumii]
MNTILDSFIKNERQQRLIKRAANIAKEARLHVSDSDREAVFSDETLKVIKQEGYPSFTLPAKYGGEDLSLYEFLLLQETIAVGDGSTALSMGWHLGIVMELSDDKPWKLETFERLASEIASEQKVVNRLATEAGTGSPTRGGIPETKAVKREGRYVLTGRKTFASMADHLDYYIVSAYVEDLDEVGWFLIDRHQPGLRIDKIWDTLGMRGTESDDLILDEVEVNEHDLVEIKGQSKPSPKGWLLHIPACYLGIAVAARDAAIEFAVSFQPNSLDTTISEVGHIRDKIGEMEWKLMQAHSFMYATARKWDEEPEKRMKMGTELAAVKLAVTNTANEVVDLAMRIAGGRGLSKQQPFEKLYRDVRAGLHNPPMDDAVLRMLAGKALD